MYECKHAKRLQKRVAVTVLCLSFVLILVIIGGLGYAKYVSGWGDVAGKLESGKFYFTSDYLTDGEKTYTVYSDSVSFQIANNDGAGYSSENIEYEITLTDESGKAELNGNSGILTGGGANADTVTLIANGAAEVTVVAKAKSPYEETIGATFKFVIEKSTYTVEEYENHIELNITTGSSVNDITVNHGGLVPDKTGELAVNCGGEYCTIDADDLEPMATYKLVFFKTDTSKTYTRAETEFTEEIFIISDNPPDLGGENPELDEDKWNW